MKNTSIFIALYVVSARFRTSMFDSHLLGVPPSSIPTSIEVVVVSEIPFKEKKRESPKKQCSDEIMFVRYYRVFPPSSMYKAATIALFFWLSCYLIESVGTSNFGVCVCVCVCLLERTNLKTSESSSICESNELNAMDVYA